MIYRFNLKSPHLKRWGRKEKTMIFEFNIMSFVFGGFFAYGLLGIGLVVYCLICGGKDNDK